MSYLNDLRTGELWVRMKSYINNKLSVVDDKILHAGYSRQTLLWTNPNPNSSFVAQTVALDLSDYDGILLQYYVYQQDANGMHSVIVPVGDYGSMNIATSVNRARNFQVLSTGVTFKDATKWVNYSSSASTDNAWLTPYRIYGLKNGIPVSEADDALLSLKGVSKMIKLWENASPTSTFSAQTISLDLSEYEYILVVFRCSSFYSAKLLKVGQSVQLTEFTHVTSLPQTEAPYIFAREVKATTNEITVYQCVLRITSNTSYGTIQNGSNVPIYIYGIKGVQ